MIDENLMRQELSAAERAEHVARRKELYEALHPETANGALGRGHTKVRQNGEPSEAPRFTKATADATGQSETLTDYLIHIESRLPMMIAAMTKRTAKTIAVATSAELIGRLNLFGGGLVICCRSCNHNTVTAA